jgi:hypothetical protein
LENLNKKTILKKTSDDPMSIMLKLQFQSIKQQIHFFCVSLYTVFQRMNAILVIKSKWLHFWTKRSRTPKQPLQCFNSKNRIFRNESIISFCNVQENCTSFENTNFLTVWSVRIDYCRNFLCWRYCGKKIFMVLFFSQINGVRLVIKSPFPCECYNKNILSIDKFCTVHIKC